VTITSTALTIPLINELDTVTPGGSGRQFVELYGAPGLSLNGYILVFFNGTTDTSYLTVDLAGYVMDTNGYFLVGNTAVTPDIIITDGIIQNGNAVAGAVALYQAASASFPNGTAVTVTGLIDALVYKTRATTADDAGLAPLLNAGQPQVNEDLNAARNAESMQRVPNASGGFRNTSSYQVKASTARAAN
jgi:hypothetical protein